MPDLLKQFQVEDGYVHLPVIAHTVWWRQGGTMKWAGRMPQREAEMTIRLLNAEAAGEYWRAPVYLWTALLPAQA